MLCLQQLLQFPEIAVRYKATEKNTPIGVFSAVPNFRRHNELQ